MDSRQEHVDLIASLLAAPPPRQVPPELQRVAMRQSAPLALVFMGAFFFCFGMLFVLVFFPWGFSRQWKLDSPGAATAAGKITAVERTGMSINKRTVMRYTFEFSPRGALEMQKGTCYTTGTQWEAGATVTVRYRPDDPSLASVEGARLSEGNWAMAFILIFPAIGGTMVFLCLRARRRSRNLLVHGEVTEANVVSIEPTSTTINDHRVFAISLKRVDRPDDPPMQVKKHQPDVVAFAQERLESKQPVFVLYDPKNPKRALLPEVL